jgi:hypothetical protein
MLNAQTIGGRADAALERCPHGRVIGVHRVACHLLTDEGDFLMWVTPEVGAGPLSIVSSFEGIETLLTGAAFVRQYDQITISGQQICLAEALPWDAQMDWAALADGLERIQSMIDVLHPSLDAAWEYAADAGLREVAGAVADVVEGAERSAVPALSALCGRGPGLTPAGDDWLVGWLLGLHLARPALVARWGAWAVRVAPTRTNRISRAFIACAVNGEVDADWRAWLWALFLGGMLEDRYEMTTRKLLTRGATSGVAMLTGFAAAIALPRCNPQVQEEHVSCLF